MPLKSAISASLLAGFAALFLASCGDQGAENTAENTETAPSEPDFSDEIAEDLAALEAGSGAPQPGNWNETDWPQARSVFDAMCKTRGIDVVLCGCVRNNLRKQYGSDAVFVSGVTFGARPDLARAVSARLTKSEREDAAAAYLETNRACQAKSG